MRILVMTALLIAINLPANAAPIVIRNINGSTVKYSIPNGYVDTRIANPRAFSKVSQLLASNGTELLSFFAPIIEADVYDEYQEYFSVRITKYSKSRRSTERDIAELSRQFKNDTNLSGYGSNDKIRTEANTAIGKIRSDLLVKHRMPLGLIYDDKFAISTVTATKLEIDGTEVPGLSTLAMVLLSDKIISFSAYRLLQSPSDIQRIENDTVQWIEQSLRASRRK